MVIHNPIKEGLDQYKYLSALIELPLANFIPSSKYVLERENYFLISRQPKKQEINIGPNEVVEK